MAVMTLEAFQKIVDKNLREIANNKIEEYVPDKISEFYNVIKSDRPYEELWELEGLPDMVPFTGAHSYATLSPGYYRRIEPGEFSLAVSMERKLVDDDQFGVIEDRVSMLRRSNERTRQKKAVRPFALCFSTAFDFMTSEEGKALCSTTHLTKVPGVSTASGFSNAGTTALSKTAIDAARYAMTRFRDGIGELANVQGDMLIVPESLYSAACEYVGYDPRSGASSMLDPDAMNNKINRSAGIKVASWGYLDDYSTTNWFMVDSRMMKKFLIWINRMVPDYKSSIDFDTEAVKARVYDRFGYGTNAWQWIYGNQVS